MNDSIIFYKSYYEALRDLPRDIQGEIYTAIMEYGLYGNETDNLKPVAKSIFTLIKPNIDANIKRRENCRKNGEKGGEHGSKGGRPKTPKKPLKNPEAEAKKPPYMELDKELELDKDMDEKEKNRVLKEKFMSVLQSYISEIHSQVNAEDFFNYYDANGWQVQGKPMKNWKLAVQTWTKKDRQERPWLYEQPKQETTGELWES